jgi:rhamnogalacturonan endolyase
MKRIIGVVLMALLASRAPAAVDMAETAESVILSNRLVALRFEKAGGRVRSLVFGGRELLGNGGVGYIQIYTSRQTDRVEWKLRVVRREPGLVEIAFVNVNPQFPFELENRYVLREGDPGFYNYIILGHDADKHPGVFGMGQLNFCLRADPQIFTTAAVDDQRIQPFPSPEALRRSEQVMDTTFRMSNGEIYEKYFYSAAMDENHLVHGVMGQDTGLWIVMPSHEHLNGGPEHQELTVHQTDTTPVLLCHYVAGHYGAGGVTSDSRDGSWRKASAPWFVYVNAGTNLWADAKQRAANEASAWPYPWLDDELFQLRRGAVAGRLVFDDRQPAAGARVVLTPHEENPSPLGWQRAWRGYRFYGYADADGRFRIAKARPGLYDLYAWKKGVLGQFRKSGVLVNARQTAPMGELVWTRPRDRELVWQIGLPDRTAAEFGFAENFRQWGLWNKIAAAYPHGVAFTVGQNTERDLPFEMAVTQASDFSWTLPVWRIQFDNRTQRTGSALLTLALAETECNVAPDGLRMRISLNGEEIAQLHDFVPDAAAHRSGIYGLYQERRVTVDAARLKKGTNVFTLELLPPSAPLDHRIGYPGSALMFDCLRLELEKPQSRWTKHSSA